MAKIKKKPTPKPSVGEKYLEKKFASSVYGLFSNLLSSMPAADISWVERHEGKSWVQVAEEMMNDADISSTFGSRMGKVSGSTWVILPAEGPAKAKEIAAFISKVLDQIPRFVDVFDHLLQAIPHGHSVAEVVWTESGADSVPEKLALRRYDRFSLSENGKDILLLNEGSFEKTPVLPKKIIYHRHGRQDDYPFERPLLLTLYWPWYFKKHAWAFWLVVAEKWGLPSMLGRYPQHFTDDDLRDYFVALKNLQQDSVAVAPEGTDIEILKGEVGEKGVFFRTLLEFCVKQISKAVLGGTLTQDIGDKGSYAAAETHMDVRQDIIEADARQLQGTIDATLIAWLVEVNFGFDAAAKLCPGLKINVEPERGTKDHAETLGKLHSQGVRVPVDYYVETFGLPAGTKIVEPVSDTSKEDLLPFE